MATVGIRELKQNFSQYMRKIRSGETIIITDRKKDLALMMPMNPGSRNKQIVQLITAGMARWSGGKPNGLKSRVVSKGASVSSAVIEDRR